MFSPFLLPVPHHCLPDPGGPRLLPLREAPAGPAGARAPGGQVRLRVQRPAHHAGAGVPAGVQPQVPLREVIRQGQGGSAGEMRILEEPVLASFLRRNTTTL